MQHSDAIVYTALEHYGVQHQIVKCMEECGELIQALARNMCGEHYAENVAEELADVEIMLMQMRIAFGRHKVDRIKAQKLARLKMRMEEEEE
jgi:NTP pyrophosphatase (non-canonical NTP hydrolase)